MKLVSLFAAGTLAAFSADPSALVVDRGLPQANWNNAAGVAERSNVRWTLYEQGFVADEFRLGEPGEKWVVDKIRVWAVPGAKGVDPAALGDFYSKVQLFVGPAEGDLKAVASADLAPGSNAGSANVRILNGVMEGVKQLLGTLSPQAIEQRYEKRGKRGGLFSNKYEGLWQEYQTAHSDYQGEDKETFLIIFGPQFSRAYAATTGEAYTASGEPTGTHAGRLPGTPAHRR